MSIGSVITSALSGIVSPIANVFTKRNENKTKIAQQNIERIMNAEDKLAEWENIVARGGNGSWKDEYVTIIITFPVPVLWLCVFFAVATNNPALAEAATQATKAVQVLVPNYGELLITVCLAAVGIRMLKK